MIRKVILFLTMIFLAISCFVGGMYVGLDQGLLYALGLEARGARYRILTYERGELREGEFKEMADAIIDSNIAYFGKHLEDDWFIHQIPSPWSFNDSGEKFMRTAIEYRLENPRKNEEKLQSILGQELSEEFLVKQLELMRNPKGELDMTEEDTINSIEEFFNRMKAEEKYYQKALRYIDN